MITIRSIYLYIYLDKLLGAKQEKLYFYGASFW